MDVTCDTSHTRQDYTPGREPDQALICASTQKVSSARKPSDLNSLRILGAVLPCGNMGSQHENVGERIARLRRSAGLKQQELARRSGLHLSSLNQIERGHRTPATATIERIATALKVGRDTLLDGEARDLAPAPASHEVSTLSPDVVTALQKAIYGMLQDAIVAIGLSIEHREREAKNARREDRLLADPDAGSRRTR